MGASESKANIPEDNEPKVMMPEGTQLSIRVTYCRNWDGGKQEFNTAKDAVLSACPNAIIEENRIEEYPVRVSITHGENELWSGRQQSLFRKNSGQRMESIKEIKAAVRKYVSAL
jgi:hypothetical protein